MYGLNAAQALNKSYHRGPSALRGSAIVTQAVTGTEEHDLSKLIASIGKVTAALNVHEQDLGELIGNFNTFFHSFAVQSPSLSATVAVLPGALHSVNRGFAALDAALPPTRTFALDLIPGVKQTARDDQRGAAVDRTGAGLACAQRARWRRQGPGHGHAGARQACSANSPRSSSRPTRSASA